MYSCTHAIITMQLSVFGCFYIQYWYDSSAWSYHDYCTLHYMYVVLYVCETVYVIYSMWTKSVKYFNKNLATFIKKGMKLHKEYANMLEIELSKCCTIIFCTYIPCKLQTVMPVVAFSLIKMSNCQTI